MSSTPSARRRLRSAPPGFRSRWRLVSSTAFSAVALVASGCGGGEPTEEPQPAQPELPAALAESLATQADEVASRLADGDVEGARKLALELHEDVVRAREEGEIPAALGTKLLAAVDRLLASIPIVEEPQEAPEEPEEGEGEGEGEGEDEGKGEKKGKGDEKGNGKGKGENDEEEDADEDEATTGTVEVTTTVG